MAGRWQYFPSVDDVLDTIQDRRNRKADEAMNRDWDLWKSEMQHAKENGLLATEEDYAHMRQRLREIFGDPKAKQTGRNKPNAAK